MTNGKVDLCSFKKMKQQGRPITMVTAYDYPTARILDEAGVDAILVGDSVSNVVLGHPDTLPVTLEEMLHHARAVVRGVKRALVIADMPFMSFNVSTERSIENAGRFLKEAGAQAVKIEGGIPATAAAIVQAGIPLVGHLGLTPQTAAMLGGYTVQGKTAEVAKKILADALALEQAGAFLLVLECVPEKVAALVAVRLRIPVIGIGAGVRCDGQVLVFHDLVGINFGFKPKFVKTFAEIGQQMRAAVEAYCTEVRARQFPTPEHSFAMPDEELAALQQALGEPRGR